jgi:hypothetical protein
MSSFLRRFFCRDFGPTPPPDLADRPSIPGQNIIDTLYSDSNQQRAIITRDTSGIYRIHVQFWDTSDWKAGYGARWSGVGSGSFTDTVEVARALAREELAELHQRAT